MKIQFIQGVTLELESCRPRVTYPDGGVWWEVYGKAPNGSGVDFGKVVPTVEQAVSDAMSIIEEHFQFDVYKKEYSKEIVPQDPSWLELLPWLRDPRGRDAYVKDLASKFSELQL